MKETAISIIAIIALAILGVVISYTQPEASKLLYAIVAAIAGIGGHYIPKAVVAFRSEVRRYGLKMTWKRYHFRVIGFALAGAGLGLIVDELIAGPFSLTPTGHEFWGIVLFVAGMVFISLKPKGKD